jgi:hypothetical protein
LLITLASRDAQAQAEEFQGIAAETRDNPCCQG